MDRGSPLDVALLLFIALGGTMLLVAVHECGHAFAALTRGVRVYTIRIGTRPATTLSIGPTRVEIGWTLGHGDVGGYITHDRRASPTDVLIIALAGPVANLIAAAATGVLAANLISHGMIAAILALLTVQGLALTVVNLIPTGSHPDRWSDGRWVRAAWQSRRMPIGPLAPVADPRAATSMPPPRLDHRPR
jgi:hypothetical protein